MTITIAHLYYDLLNLYGENGNVKALFYHLQDQGIHVKIKFLTTTDQLDFQAYDVVYMGMGTEQNQKLALKHLLKYKKEMKQAIEENKFFLITGNALDLFGKKIMEENKKPIKALEIFPYTIKQETFRMVGEAVFESNLIAEPIIGFQNQCSTLKENHSPLFEVKKGIGSYPGSKTEGVLYKNFYGTYLIGPLFIRNPHLLKLIVKRIIMQKNDKFKFKKFNLALDLKAYNHYVETQKTT